MVPFKTNKELEEILDICLDRLAEGESIEECLSDYPHHRESLLNLLEISEITSHLARSLIPSHRSKLQGAARFREQVEQNITAGSPERSLRGRIARPLAIPMAAVLVFTLLLLGVGSIAAVAADDSVPGDNLYWIKITKENVILTLTRSGSSKAQVHAELAGKRGEEMRKLMEQGRISAAEKHLQEVRWHLRISGEQAGVVITLNRIDMPSTGASIEQPRELIALIVTLERGGELLRIRPVLIKKLEFPENKQRIERIQRDFELSYWALASALNPDATSGIFWRTEKVGSQLAIR